jgi:hypothetical protein
MPASSVSVPVAEKLIAALATRDFATLVDCFTPAVQVRALVPSSFRDPVGAQAAAALFETWFGDATESRLLWQSVEPLVDKVHIAYRLRLREEGVWKICEQHAFCIISDGLIAKMDLVCSGFRDEAPAAA